MRVLLVNPPYPISETPSPPLSLAVLGAALEKAGAVVEILDLAVVPFRESDLESILSRLSPHVAGVTCVTMTVHSASRIVRVIKRLAPEVLTVMGGPHVSFCAGDTLRQLPELDCICRGEGENSLVSLCRAVDDGAGFSAVPGLVWRSGGALMENRRSGNPIDLDALPPPARHLLPLGRYRALGLPLSMITSRGCPFSCIFCVGRKMGGRRVRYRSPERVADEMKALAGLDFHQINVADDLFTANPDHCLRVCRSVGRRGLSISWTCFSRVDTVSEPLIAALAGAGCRTVSFGVESADPGILKTVKKGIRPRQVLDAVSLCVRAGITPQISFILGLPGETRRTVEKTVAFAERLQQMGATFGFHLLAPFPGTEVRQRAAQYGLRILSDDWQAYHANRAVVETDSIAANEMNRIVIGWEKKFDEYLGHLGRLRQTGTATAEEVWPLTRLEHTVVLYDLMMSRAVEKNGVWRNGGGRVAPDAALEKLSRRLKVPADASYDRDQLQKTLRFALSEGYLEMSTDADMIRWQWVDKLPHSP